MAYIPVMIDFNTRRVLIVGGGRVALRKARVLQKTGAEIRVVAKRALSPFKKWAKQGKIRLILRAFRFGDLRDCDFVVLATDDVTLNARIAVRCDTQRLLYNSATIHSQATRERPARGQVLMSSFLRRGDLIVAVSTGGVAPRASKMIVQALRRVFDKTWPRVIAAFR